MPSLPQHTSHEHSTPDNLPELTAAQADYLEIIYEEQLKTGVARGCSIAQTAGVSRATVSRYLNDGYVSQEKRAAIRRGLAERQLHRIRTYIYNSLFHCINSTLRRYYSKAREIAMWSTNIELYK